MMMLEVGQILQGRYRIEALLGKGGMGAVYRAQDLRLNTVVAIKENLDFDRAAPYETRPAPDGTDIQGLEGRQAQFEREAQILARLRHPGLPKVTDHFLLPGQGQYLVMEYIHGQSLAEVITQRGRIEANDAIRYACDACRVLEYLHTQTPPIIHRDLKPANLRLTTDGRVIVVDFGIAKEGEQGLTRTGALGVTPGFSPMEQYGGTGQTDARTDVYALGATLYAMLAGESPPPATDRFVGRPADPLVGRIPGIREDLQAVLDRSMALKPEDRFPSARSLRDQIESLGILHASTEPIGRATGTSSSTGKPTGPALDETAAIESRKPGNTKPPLDPTENVANVRANVPPTEKLSQPQPIEKTVRESRVEPKKKRSSLVWALPVGIIGAALGGFVLFQMFGPKESTPPIVPAPPSGFEKIEISVEQTVLLTLPDDSYKAAFGTSPESLLSDRALAESKLDGTSLAEIVRPLVTDLRCNESRQISARGLSAGNWISIGDSRLRGEPCPIDAPGGLSVDNVTTSGVSLRWTWNGTAFRSYRVHGSKDASFVPDERNALTPRIEDPTRLQAALTGLDCGTQYAFRVRVETEAGTADSEPAAARTAECARGTEKPVVPPSVTGGETPPGGNTGGTPSGSGTTPPQDPVETPPQEAPPSVALGAVALSPASAVDATSATLAWGLSSNPTVTVYEVHVSKSAGFDPGASSLSRSVARGERPQATISGLECATQYYARVVVKDAAGQSAVSEPVAFQTAECGLPNRIALTPAGSPFGDLTSLLTRINQEKAVTGPIRIDLAPGTYVLSEEARIAKEVEIVGSQSIVKGRMVLQAPRARLSGLTIQAEGTSAVNVPSGTLVLEDCTISAPGHSAVQGYGNGAIELTRCRIQGSSSKGVLLRDSARATLRDCTITSNESGIDASGSSELRMTGGEVSASRQSGARVHGTASIQFEGVRITANGYSGVLVGAGSRAIVRRSQVVQNQQFGVALDPGGFVTLSDTDLRGNVMGALEEPEGSTVTKEGNVQTR